MSDYIVVSEYGTEYSTPMTRQHAVAKTNSLNWSKMHEASEAEAVEAE